MTTDQKLKTGRLILASSSPRRKELLSELDIPFEVLSPDTDETAWPNETPGSFTLRMAHEKAEAVANSLDDEEVVTILAADTVVVLDNRILGKPTDKADAVRMLRDLSGNQHTVITGICIMHREGARDLYHGDAVRTSVTFRKVSEDEINAYVDSGEPMDKAGAYAIQGGAAGMVDHTDGSYSNVVGLPMERVRQLLS